jgi:acyl-CoA reductase-like NAD-dependent aldehyde dehydrogenase
MTTNAPIPGSDLESNRMGRLMTEARHAQAEWNTVRMADRLQRVRVFRGLLAEHAMTLAQASAAARCRPGEEALTAEVLPLAEACRFLEKHAARILAPRRLGARGRPIWLGPTKATIRREPHGVVLIIGPGNYPLLLPGVQLLQALVAGNAVVLKPGEGGSAVAEAMVGLLVAAGFDPRLVTLLPEAPRLAQLAIQAVPDKVVFTGSATTGQRVLTELVSTLTPATLELSGCDAVIVRADADLDLVISALFFGLTLNAGATCLAPRRLIVHRSLATEMEGRLADRFAGQTNGSGGCAIPFSSSGRACVAEAQLLGAHVVAGGIGRDGLLRLPTILAGVPSSARVLREDLFLPILSMMTVADDDEAVTQVNGNPYGLGAAVFSRDEKAAHALAARLRTGVVTINDLIVPTADARLPFGGRGRSGYGVTRGAEGLLELTVTKVVTSTRGRFRPAFMPLSPRDRPLVMAYLRWSHGNRWRAWVPLVRALVGAARARRKEPR